MLSGHVGIAGIINIKSMVSGKMIQQWRIIMNQQLDLQPQEIDEVDFLVRCDEEIWTPDFINWIEKKGKDYASESDDNAVSDGGEATNRHMSSGHGCL
jgi:hypothetical protein